eukprot:SAG11_NODE_2880_length_2875_cov_3.094020_2_plen_196_part_00
MSSSIDNARLTGRSPRSGTVVLWRGSACPCRGVLGFSHVTERTLPAATNDGIDSSPPRPWTAETVVSTPTCLDCSICPAFENFRLRSTRALSVRHRDSMSPISPTTYERTGRVSAPTALLCPCLHQRERADNEPRRLSCAAAVASESATSSTYLRLPLAMASCACYGMLATAIVRYRCITGTKLSTKTSTCGVPW